MNNNIPRPFLVKLGVWGIKTRATAIAFIWICVGIAVVSGIRHFWIGLVMLLAAAWYWYAMRWMDRHGGWTVPGKTSTQIIAAFAIIVGLLAIAVKAFFIGYYRIPQNGMYPGLPAGSGFWAYKHAYSSPSQVKRGDVIVFTRVQNERPYIYIWRVVALPGDSVASIGASLTVNARPVTRERVREEQGAVIFRERLDGAVYEVAFNESPRQRPPDSTVTVPAGYFFVMGDNRFSAYDSRYFGPIGFDSIIGKKL